MPQHVYEWQALVRLALSQTTPVGQQDLLLVHTPQGEIYRPLQPPADLAPRLGAVLILLYPDGNDLRFPLTVRSQRLVNHRGEVSLPGGAIEAGDADVAAAALRECREELGIQTNDIAVWGKLTSWYIAPSNFLITPVVASLDYKPDLHPNRDEVGQVITTTLRNLLNPDSVVTEEWILRDNKVIVPFFAIEGHKVWGATALVLSELIARMRRALPSQQSSY